MSNNNETNIYTQVNEVFMNEDDVKNFVNLDKSINCYNKIVSVLKKPLKLILFYGKPGSGKTFLLNKITADLSEQQNIIFFPHPFFNEATFIRALCERLFGEKKDGIENFEIFIKEYGKKFKDREEILQNQVIVILDEAQLYPQDLIEKIRLMADTRCFKFLFTIHKTDDEDILAKDYFQTRIWESIELKTVNMGEIIIYLQRKLALKGLEKYLKFNKKDYELAYSLCDGNLRTLNKMMYKFFEICEYYDHFEPSELTNETANNKILTMAAIDTGIIDA